GKTYELYDDTLIHLGGLAQGAFEKQVHQFIDVHTPLQNHIAASRAKNPDYRYGDGVHPPTDGHLVFALAILAALGEDQAEAKALLQKLTGVSLETDTSEIPQQAALWKGLQERFRTLSKVYRDQTRPETRDAPPNLDEAVRRAGAIETRLRAELMKAIKP
ncbi:MAG: hypothetical protein AAF514_14780, partial [Verrucomicrobiota bacterium]